MKRYRAVIFDLFDTVVLFDYMKMPEIVVKGNPRRTTMGVTYELLRERCPDVGWDAFFDALADEDDALRAQKEAGKEISSTARFSGVVKRLVPERPDLLAREFIEDLVGKHMRALLDCAHLPAEHPAVLEELGRTHRIALLSNFDHAPAAEAMIDDMGLRKYFVHIAISDKLGWRKPHPRVFLRLVEELGVEPGETLYVGDTYETDVVGAKSAGLDAAWVNPRGLEPGEVRPDIEVRGLPELRDRLSPGGKGRGE